MNPVIVIGLWVVLSIALCYAGDRIERAAKRHLHIRERMGLK